jgi:hypothetical protein
MTDEEPQMTLTTLAQRHPRELAHRVNDGIEVTLSWHPDTDELTVSVSDERRGAYFVLRPERHLALDVFYHPYSYAPPTEAPFEDERLAA